MPVEPGMQANDQEFQEAEAHEALEEAVHGLEQKLHHAQDILFRLRENLMGQQQRELETLLAEGYDLVTSQFQQLRGDARTMVGDAKSNVKVNPYAGIVAALRVGLAISQVMSARKQRSMVPSPVMDQPTTPGVSDQFATDPVARGDEFVSNPENYATRH